MKRHYGRRHNFQFKKSRRQYNTIKNRFERLISSRVIYRSRQGIFMGVCQGLADYFSFNVFWLRIIVLVLFLFTGFWPVGVMYIIAGLLLKVEPVSPLHNEKDREFYDNYANSRQSAIQRIKRKFDNIERRIQRMEHTVTSKEFDWK
ncbi:envelope stress response membrane protein PspC [Desulfobacula phenolica]|uniref:Phage shock protein C (PspC) family protein n=1 Tax=Desulfobacula phenolica TaxID=90732 RepID=A0A1H2JFG6_9BACT|nr:envelope stress response membrane protein PspC [Desulfobacula phenolica]SDU54865.1 phage shock protein C (PspC) family protein [Desulfobacula phenolica]